MNLSNLRMNTLTGSVSSGLYCPRPYRSRLIAEVLEDWLSCSDTHLLSVCSDTCTLASWAWSLQAYKANSFYSISSEAYDTYEG